MRLSKLSLAVVATTIVSTLAARVANPQYYFTFENDDCQTGSAFTNNGVIAKPLTYNTTQPRCPTASRVVDGSNFTYDNAHNGLLFSGAHGTYESATFEATKIQLGLPEDGTAQMTFEFWLMPLADCNPSSAEEEVLLEFAQATIGTTWKFNDEVDFRISYLECNIQLAAYFQFPTTLQVNLQKDVLSHIVITTDFNSGGYTGKVYKDGALVATESTNNFKFNASNPDIDFERVYIGATPNVISTDIPDSLISFKGSIVAAAFYNQVLSDTQVADNYAAYIPNNKPVVANEAVTTFGKEDTTDGLTFGGLFYDLDVASAAIAGLSGQSLSPIVTGDLQLTSGFNGTLRVNNADVTSVPVTSSAGASPLSSVDTADSIQYTPSVQDAYHKVTSIMTFQVGVTDGLESSSTTSTVTLQVLPTNDSPESGVQVPGLTGAEQGSVTSIAQRRFKKLALTGFDKDCTVDDTSESCDTFGISKGSEGNAVTIKQNTQLRFGKLYKTLGNGDCDPFSGSSDLINIVAGDVSLPLPDDDVVGEVAVFVCYEACLNITGSNLNECPGDIDIDSAILGSDSVTYFYTDAAGAQSGESSMAIEVTNVLSTDLRIVDVDPPIKEGTTTVRELQLKGVDSLCDDLNGVPEDPSCATRTKEFFIKTLPTEGTLYKDVQASQPIVAGDLPYKVVEAEKKVYFVPNPTFYNRDTWPLCGSSKNKAWMFCPNEKVTTNFEGFECEGPFCKDLSSISAPFEAYTTRNLAGELMGSCDPEDTTACPVKIMYTMKVGDLESKESAGYHLYVDNKNTEGGFNFEEGVVVDEGNKKLEKLNVRPNGNPVRLVDSDLDNRVMKVVVETENSTISSRGTIEFPGFVASNPNQLKELDATYRVSRNKHTFIGIGSEINRALELLTWTTTINREVGVITITVDELAPEKLHIATTGQEEREYIPFSYSTRIELKLDPGEDEELGVGLVTYAIWGGVAFLGLLCLGTTYVCVHGLIRRALKGERVALWIVRNVLFTHIDAHHGDDHALDDEVSPIAKNALKQIHDERVRFERVQFCAHLINLFCPCCKKIKVEKKDLPTEDELTKSTVHQLQARVASHNLPSGRPDAKSERFVVDDSDIFNWQRHETLDEKTGRVLEYYYNVKTDESSWLPPSVKVKKNAKRGVRASAKDLPV